MKRASGYSRRSTQGAGGRSFTATSHMLPTNADLSPDELEKLRRLDTCTLSNAIERMNIRLRNEGFMTGAVTCRFPKLAPVIGYAVTARMRSSMLPIGGRCYHEHPEFWRYVDSLASPRMVVIQDVDHSPGLGSVFGEIHARISRALGLRGLCNQRRGARSAGRRGARVPVVLRGCFGVSRLCPRGGFRRTRADWRSADPSRRPSARRSPWSAHHSDGRRPRIARGRRADIAGDRELFAFTSRKDFSVDLLTAKLQKAVDGCQ